MWFPNLHLIFNSNSSNASEDNCFALLGSHFPLIFSILNILGYYFLAGVFL